MRQKVFWEAAARLGLPAIGIAKAANIHPSKLSKSLHGWLELSSEEKERLATVLQIPRAQLFYEFAGK
jgi:hypothetical protein